VIDGYKLGQYSGFNGGQNLSLLDLSQRLFYLLFCIQLWVNLVLNLIVAGLAVVLVAFIVTITEKTNAGFVGVALVTVVNFNMSLTNLMKYWTMLETSMGAITRIKCFVKDVAAEREPAIPATLDPCWPQQGRIEISNLTVSYGYDMDHTLESKR
jgi:ATP-binding cassette subfamily C (CFTR/MRP) protein 1